MLHTLIMSILTSRFGHSSNVNRLYDRPWTSYDSPYVTQSGNVHPYFMILTLCECPCTFLRLLFCPTPCVHMLPPMMVYIQVHILATHPCVLWIVVMVCVRRMMMRMWWVLCITARTHKEFLCLFCMVVCVLAVTKNTHTHYTHMHSTHTHMSFCWVSFCWVSFCYSAHTHIWSHPSVVGPSSFSLGCCCCCCCRWIWRWWDCVTAFESWFSPTGYISHWPAQRQGGIFCDHLSGFAR